MRRTLQLAFSFLLALSFLASACTPAATPSPTSGATSAPAKAATVPATAKPGASPAAKTGAEKPPIKIGYLTSLTGPFGQNGTDMKDGFALYLTEKGNTLAGRKVELVVEDDQTDPQVGLTKTKKLVERDGVQMIAGIVSSGVVYALSDYLVQQKVPLLINNAGADDLTKQRFSPYIFRNSFSNSQSSHVAGDWAFKQGYRRAAIVASDFAAGYEFGGGFAKVFTDSGGQILQEQYPPLNAADAAPFVTAINPNAEIVFAFMNAQDAIRFVTAFDQYGLKQKMVAIGFTGLSEDSVLPGEGNSALGNYTSGVWSSAMDTPANKAFMDSFQKQYNRQVSYGPAMGYNGAQMLDQALQAINGNIEDSAAFITAMENASLTDSPRGPVKFDKYHNAIIDVYITQVKNVNGKLVNSVIDTYKGVSQFWTYNPDDFLKMTPYSEMKGKWAK